MDLTLVTTVADAVAGISYPNILMMLAIIFLCSWSISLHNFLCGGHLVFL